MYNVVRMFLIVLRTDTIFQKVEMEDVVLKGTIMNGWTVPNYLCYCGYFCVFSEFCCRYSFNYVVI